MFSGGVTIMIARFVKKHKAVAAAIFAPILICIVGFMLIACTPQDIKADDAIAIAKKDFGCDKVLWIDTDALIFDHEPGSELTTQYTLRSHYAYYVVGEKDGKEIYIIIPSNPKQEKPYIATWNLDYSFTQIVEKFNEHGARYVADVPDDYYSVSVNSYISIHVGQRINGLATHYEVGIDDDAFYESLDVKVVFEYIWEEEGNIHSCIVIQESGQLKSYENITEI